jgi:hypothetical protein
MPTIYDTDRLDETSCWPEAGPVDNTDLGLARPDGTPFVWLEELPARRRRGAWRLDLCRDGILSLRARDEEPFNGLAMPVAYHDDHQALQYAQQMLCTLKPERDERLTHEHGRVYRWSGWLPGTYWQLSAVARVLHLFLTGDPRAIREAIRLSELVQRAALEAGLLLNPPGDPVLEPPDKERRPAGTARRRATSPRPRPLSDAQHAALDSAAAGGDISWVRANTRRWLAERELIFPRGVAYDEWRISGRGQAALRWGHYGVVTSPDGSPVVVPSSIGGQLTIETIGEAEDLYVETSALLWRDAVVATGDDVPTDPLFAARQEILAEVIERTLRLDLPARLARYDLAISAACRHMIERRQELDAPGQVGDAASSSPHAATPEGRTS